MSSSIEVAAAHPAPKSVAARFARRPRGAMAFAAAILLICLLLQRFGLPLGRDGMDIVGPIGLLLAAGAFYKGVLTLHRRRLILLLLLTLWLVLGAFWQVVHPNGYGLGLSLPSLAQFLLLTAFGALSFREAQDEAMFFRGAADILLVVAIAGIAQFALQFVGLSVFEYTGILPGSLLYEAGYNLSIPVGIGSALKSNGFFLLEPSIFSQAMAMALIIEALGGRRAWWMVAFAAGLVLSFSGTGWIVLAAFLLSVGTRLGGKGILIAAGVAAGLVLAGAVSAIAIPDIGQIFADRLGEIAQPGTSGNMRFITPFHMLQDVLARENWAWLLGIGGGTSEHLGLAYDYDVNTPIKVMIEYGLPALVLYVSLFLVAERTRLQSALVVPAIVLVLLTGGYQEFAPVLFPIFLLICVARLRPTPKSPA